MIEDGLRLGLDDDIPGIVEYANLPRQIGALISAGKATLNECATVYSVEDVYLMLEVVAVDAHNRRMAEDHAKRTRDRG